MKVPSKRTLAKYGMGEADFRFIWWRQGGLCAICNKPLGKGMVFVDHWHVRGFKSMPAHEKRKYVRGLLCFTDNKYHVAKNTRDTIDAVHTYLRREPPLV